MTETVKAAEEVTVLQTRIRERTDYIYIGHWPEDCNRHRYRVIKFIVDVPSYQQKVLVKALTGPDAGLWFTCSLGNFATRYRLAE